MTLGKRLITIACRGKEKKKHDHAQFGHGLHLWNYELAYTFWKCLISLWNPTCRIKPKENKTPFKRPEQQHLAMDIADYSFLWACALLSNISYEILDLRDADFRKRERNNFCFHSKERKQARKKIHSLAVMCSVVLNIKWSISYKPIKRPLRDLLTCFSDTFGDVVCTGKHFTFD